MNDTANDIIVAASGLAKTYGFGLLKAGGLLNERLIAVHFLAAKRGDIAVRVRGHPYSSPNIPKNTSTTFGSKCFPACSRR